MPALGALLSRWQETLERVPMFLLELFATMKARRLSSQRHNEEGAEITRRLLDATKPKQVETLFTIAASGSMPQSPEPLRRK